MPDAGDFQRDADDTRGANIGWGEAFAALPLDAPDAGGWKRVQARLPAAAVAKPRTRWPLWVGTAASLLLAVAIPLRMLPTVQPRSTAPVPSVSPAASGSTPGETAPFMSTVATPAVAAERQPEPATAIAHPAAKPRVSPSQRPIRTAARPSDATRVAAIAASTPVDLEPLYVQSAQLESLLALARDDRVASGTSAALSDALDTRVAAIDATLIQPGLSDAQRSDLWSQRVDALQQLVGIETTNRLYAARGQSYDAALVSID